jgi:hypothetical protein
LKVLYTGHPQTIIVGDMRLRVKPGSVVDVEDPKKVFRDKMGRRLWEAVEE